MVGEESSRMSEAWQTLWWTSLDGRWGRLQKEGTLQIGQPLLPTGARQRYVPGLH